MVQNSTSAYGPYSAAQLPIPVLVRQRTVTQRWTTPRTVHTSNRIQCASDNRLLSCYVINACSLKKPNALQLLITKLCNFAIDVAAVTETWLNSNVSSCELTISGYKLFRRDREGRKGGGLCIFVKDSVTADSIIIPTANSESTSDYMHEILHLKLVKNNQVYLFCWSIILLEQNTTPVLCLIDSPTMLEHLKKLWSSVRSNTA